MAPPHHATEWRVVLGEAAVLIGPRCTPAPLHRRPWKIATVPGTLRPPVAAAMARLARVSSGHLAVHPCCGAGTILIEASIQQPGAQYVGSDISIQALNAAAANGQRRRHMHWVRQQATQLPYTRAPVNRIVSNSPWGRQVAARRRSTSSCTSGDA